jgi:hypothetical protein
MDNQGKTQVPSDRIGIIRSVQTPLGFFVLVVLVVEAILGGVAYASDTFNSTLALISMVAILFALIAVVAFMAYYRPEALKGIRAARLPVQATVIYPPTEKNRYNKLFDNFSDCDFFAFNPPFQVEFAGDRIHEEALNTHKRRYESKVKSRYLFFDKESYENAERFFDALAKRIGKEKVNENINRIYWENSSEAPGYTYFIGYKHENPAIVLYPSAVLHSGIPRAVIFIEGAQDLLVILREFFLKQWKEAYKHYANL